MTVQNVAKNLMVISVFDRVENIVGKGENTGKQSLQTTISNLTKKAKSYPNRVKNTVGKVEIDRYERILLFPQCFQKASFPGLLNVWIVW